MAPSDVTYTYTGLDASKQEFRLLKILPETQDDATIQCQLYIVSMSKKPRYLTLSYVWGDEAIPKEEIIVDNKVLHIMPNLVSALKHLRRDEFFWRRYTGEGVPDSLKSILASSPSEDTTHITEDSELSPLSSLLLWADAICINQEDIQERSTQVQMMSAIYSQAICGISWLGEDIAGRFNRGFGLMMLIADELGLNPGSHQSAEWLTKYPSLLHIEEDESIYSDHWASIESFQQLEYWKRKWIIQEVVLPKTVLFLAGNSMIPSNDIAFASFFLDNIQNGTITRPKGVPKPMWVLLQSQLKTFQVIVCLGLREELDQGWLSDPSSAFLTATRCMAFACSDPRDHIFALQGLRKDAPFPDYHKTTKSVYCEFVQSWVEESSRIDFLEYAGMRRGSNNDFGLPTWVPDWHFLSKSHEDRPKTREYHADKEINPLCKDKPSISANFSLNCSGVLKDEVEIVVPPYTGTFVELCHELGTERGIQAMLTILRQSTEEFDEKNLFKSKDAAIGVFICFLWLLAWDGSEFNLDTITSELEKLGLIKNGSCSPIFFEYFSSLDRSKEWASHKTWERALFDHIDIVKQLVGTYKYASLLWTSQEQFIYSFSPEVCKGDKIFILSGCKFPVLLREGVSYSFVGPCYGLESIDHHITTSVRNGEAVIECLVIS